MVLCPIPQEHVYSVSGKSKVANQGFGNNASHAGWHDDRHQVVLDSSPLEISPDLEPDGRIMDAFKAHQDLGIISKQVTLYACTAWDTSFPEDTEINPSPSTLSIARDEYCHGWNRVCRPCQRHMLCRNGKYSDLY